MEMRIPLSDLDFGEEETQAVLDVLSRRWLTMGALTQAFEQRFAEMVGARHAFALSNGTVALHLACLALGIGPGDEVIVPSLSFVATANAVLYTGAQVRFVDILGPQELNIDPAQIEQAITQRTKAIIVMHYGGYPCRMVEIMAIAARYGLAVIEDAAHAPGATLEGRAMGTWGAAGCFSFFSNKNLAVGEGGMLVTDRDDIAEKVRLLRSHGMTSLTWDRHQGHAYSYDVLALGYNYRSDEIRAAIGLAQLEKLAPNNTRRAALTDLYWQLLAGSALELPFRHLAQQEDATPAHHIFPILLPFGADRKTFMDRLRAAGIQTSIHYPPIHQFSYHRELQPGLSLPKTERAAAREVTLPLYPTMGRSAVQYIADTIEHAL